jgi:hypothetical protein
MNDSKSTNCRIAFLGLFLLTAALPACQGTHIWSRNQADPSSRVAYRPTPTSLRGRTFYVSGYGGADYSPNRTNCPAPVGAVPAYDTPAPAVNAPEVTVRQGTWDEP